MANLCEAYPCHEDLPKDFSCEFCYCPEYDDPKCSGKPKWIKLSNRGRLKDCSECTVPHTSEYVTKYYKEKKDGRNKGTVR